MTDNSLYYAIPWSSQQVDPQTYLVCTRNPGMVVCADSSAIKVLGLCQGARTIAEHVDTINRAAPALSGASSEALLRFVGAGLLRPFHSPPQLPQTKPPRIETVGVVSADRPHQVSRAVADAVRTSEKFSRRIRLVVVDASISLQNRDKTRAAVEKVPDHVESTYIGHSEIDRLCDHLVQRGFDHRGLTAGMRTGAAGANRNILLLLTAGQPLLMVDDDVRWAVWQHHEHQQQIVFGAHTSPYRTSFFDSRQEAIAAAGADDKDLLSIHETLLGRTARALLLEHPDLTQACGHLLTLVLGRAVPSVRVTMMGLAGDSGTENTFGLLLGSGPTKRELVENHTLFHRAMRSRERHRIVTQPFILHDSHCMAFCMGVDNTTLLPAFFPIGRGEDSVFGAATAFVDPNALFGHLPWGIIHDSDRPSAQESGVASAVNRSIVTDLAMAVVRHASAILAAPDVSVRSRLLAQVFRDVSALPQVEFCQYVMETFAAQRTRELSGLRAAEFTDSMLPDFWIAASQNAQTELLESVLNPRMLCPVEFRSADSDLTDFERLQSFMKNWTMFVEAWPSMWEYSCGANLLDAVKS